LLDFFTIYLFLEFSKLPLVIFSVLLDSSGFDLVKPTQENKKYNGNPYNKSA